MEQPPRARRVTAGELFRFPPVESCAIAANFTSPACWSAPQRGRDILTGTLRPSNLAALSFFRVGLSFDALSVMPALGSLELQNSINILPFLGDCVTPAAGLDQPLPVQASKNAWQLVIGNYSIHDRR
jgi:hypothetical protein